MIADLDGYIDREAARKARLRIADAEQVATQQIREAQSQVQRLEDLLAEMRRQIAALDKQTLTGLDRRRIMDALDELPKTCRYHGDNLDREHSITGRACCDTGRPARARRDALRALNNPGTNTDHGHVWPRPDRNAERGQADA